MNTESKPEGKDVQVLVQVINNNYKTVSITGLKKDLSSTLIRLVVNTHVNIMCEMCKEDDITIITDEEDFQYKTIEISRNYTEKSEQILKCMIEALTDIGEYSKRKINILEQRSNIHYG